MPTTLPSRPGHLQRPLVIKIGGSTFGSGDTTVADLVTLQGRGMPLVVVHGGGALITEWLKLQSVPTTFVRGLRVTDDKSLKVVVAVLAGLANKELVGAVERAGGRAIGISGIDGAFLKARIADAALGMVGDVTEVDATPIHLMLDAGYIVLIAPVSFNVDASAQASAILNVNGDTAAGEIAATLGAERLIFLTDVSGVCDKNGQLIPALNAAGAKDLIASGVAAGGMEVKVRAALSSLRTVKAARIVDGRKPHALLDEVDGKGQGTTIAV